MNISPLLTDLYQLTMLQGYFDHDMNEEAVFEFFVRDMGSRNFFVAAGLEQALLFLEDLRFSKEDIDWLRKTGLFKDDFLDFLRDFKFTGDVYAMPEGTFFFRNEPVFQVCAPIFQAQLIETRIINILHYQTLVASKAIRMHFAAPNKQFVDFGLRRAHGAEAGLFAARASYIAGFSGTSTVLAGKEYGIPVFGTMAHSFIQAHESEEEAFIHFAESMPKNVVFLIDTYDTIKAVKKVIKIAPVLKEKGIKIRGVRLDSGDLVKLSKEVRRILDENGLKDVRIISSGSLDEYRLKELYDSGAPIDGFGIGTLMVTSSDMPYLNCAYKLMEYKGRPRKKRSEGKETWPGRKQVYRRYEGGIMSYDIMALKDEEIKEGRPLLRKYMEKGRIIERLPSVHEIREYTVSQLKEIPDYLKSLEKTKEYPVYISEGLKKCSEELDRMIDEAE